VEANGVLEEIADLEEMNGTLVYVSAPTGQFNGWTAKCSQIAEDAKELNIPKTAAATYSLACGDIVTLKTAGHSANYKVKVDDKLSSNALLAGGYMSGNPCFESLRGGYKFKHTEIIKG